MAQKFLTLILVTVVWLVGPNNAVAQRVALLIGNGTYSSPDMDLRNPTNDVVALAKSLRDLSFDVTEVTDADAETMQTSLRAFENAARGAEMALFFYAGHGVQIGGENHLIGTDFSGGEMGALRRASLAMQDVRATLGRADPKIGLIILDACRNNPFTTQGLVRPGLVRDPGGAGLLIAYATDPGNVAFDGLGNNSVYTAALLRHIATPDLDARLMLGRVRQDVVIETEGRQIPWVEEAVLGEHSFNPKPVTHGEDPQTAELARWRAISDGTQVADFEAYIADFPNGLFERFARDRVLMLRAQANGSAFQSADAVIASADPNRLSAALDALGLAGRGDIGRGLALYQQRLPDPNQLSEAGLYADAAQVSMFVAATTLQQVRTDLVALRSIKRTLKISRDALAQMQEIAKTNPDADTLVEQAKRDINGIRRAQNTVLRRLDQSRTYYDTILTRSSEFFPEDASLALLGGEDASRNLVPSGVNLNENASLFLRHLAQVENTTKGSYIWLADLLSQS